MYKILIRHNSLDRPTTCLGPFALLTMRSDECLYLKHGHYMQVSIECKLVFLCGPTQSKGIILPFLPPQCYLNTIVYKVHNAVVLDIQSSSLNLTIKVIFTPS